MQVTDQKSVEKYYQALLAKDAAYVGLFFVGVKTTGIFCIATCRARKPKFENVEFFTTVKELLQHGYRPCKICKPTQKTYEAPADIQQALLLLQQQPKEKVKDYDLVKLGLSPKRIRRWFQQHYGVTYQAYQRMLRINLAFQELQKGQTVTQSAYETGYESLSGFGYTFKRMMGISPEASKSKTIILITRFQTQLGPMYACATEKGLCLLEFTDRRMLETEFKDLQKRLDAVILTGENGHLKKTKEQLQAYFAGTRKDFDLDLHTPGTDFQQAVWDGLKAIPYGETRAYQTQAERLGKPRAVRAVARANGCNRVAIVIPCHRVIGKNGALTGYAGGLERKAWLLAHEKSFC